MRLSSFLVALLVLLCGGPTFARNHIAASLVAEQSAPAPGSTVTLAVRFVAEPGWHGYWKNPGDAGIETQAAWTMPSGVTAGPLQFPVPRTLIVGGLMNYVYEGEHALLVDVAIPATASPGTVLPLRARLDWLACTDKVCVPERGEVALDLRVGDGATTADFSRWRAAMPRPLGSSEARFAVAGDRFRLGLPIPASASVENAYFFPLTHGAVDYAAPQTAMRDGDRLVIETRAKEGAAPELVEGVLRVGDGIGLAVSARAGDVAPVEQAGLVTTILLAVGGALLGGLLLNVMPCVFPILSLKALSLARGGVDERAARVEGLAYTAGAVAICALLGAGLLALRASGVAAGWAFQLQNPAVIAALLLLVTAIALNLAGLFELPAFGGGGALAGRGGAAGSFWTGALAAFVATPCTGPFMGAALGAALLLPSAAAMAVFVGLGLGLALPFLLIGFVPALRRRLPKPGAWMDRFRKIMAVPMFATALGLAWILGRIAGVDRMALGLGAMLIVALALWWVGRRQHGGLARPWLPLGGAAAALLVGGVVAARPAAATLASEPFSEARLAALTAESKPTFVYFTADWCLTCKVNERGAIDRAEVRDSFAKGGVAVLVGDWTRGDAAISNFLARHGRSGVPLYLFYPAGAREPQVLPQVLTPAMLTSLVK